MNSIITALALIVLLANTSVQAQTRNNIEIPKFNDKYTQLVTQLESGKMDIDYKELRFAFIESKQYDRKGELSSQFDSLEKEMFKEGEKQESQNVIMLAKKLLSIDYTFLWAQKYLYQSYKLVGDSANYKKYKEIELSLLKSIVHGADGKTCENAWNASQVYEEYFVLRMMNAEFQKQTLTSSAHNTCDEMEVKNEDGQVVNYYFEINKMMEIEENKLKH